MTSQTFKIPERDLSFQGYPSHRVRSRVEAMKTTTNLARDQGMRHVAAQLEKSLLTLFEEFPSLCGFAVHDRPGVLDGGAAALQPDLYLTEVGLFPAPGLGEATLICEEIRDTLVQLIDERPEALELLSGRTFARTFH
jgi:hypothetical protein